MNYPERMNIDGMPIREKLAPHRYCEPITDHNLKTGNDVIDIHFFAERQRSDMEWYGAAGAKQLP